MADTAVGHVGRVGGFKHVVGIVLVHTIRHVVRSVDTMHQANPVVGEVKESEAVDFRFVNVSFSRWITPNGKLEY